jgi:hypothetical protein
VLENRPPALRQLHRRVCIVAIGVREVESEVLACAAAGIDGYVPVNAAADDLVAVLREESVEIVRRLRPRGSQALSGSGNQPAFETIIAPASR